MIIQHYNSKCNLKVEKQHSVNIFIEIFGNVPLLNIYEYLYIYIYMKMYIEYIYKICRVAKYRPLYVPQNELIAYKALLLFLWAVSSNYSGSFFVIFYFCFPHSPAANNVVYMRIVYIH